MAESKSSIVSISKRTYEIWSSHNAMRLAASLAFYTMMSIAPLLVVALTILSFVYGPHAQERLQGQAGSFVGPDGAKAIAQMLANASKGHQGLLAAVISFVIALISGSGLFLSLQEALNTIWDLRPRPDAGWKAMLVNRLTSAGMVFVALLLLVASFVVTTVVNMVVKHMGPFASVLSHVGDVVISLGLIACLFALVFKYLPDAKIAWSDVWPGAIVTSILFIVGKYALTEYFRFAAVASPFGAAGSLAALLIWVYYSSMLLFLGAAFTRAYAERTGRAVQPGQYAISLTPEDRVKAGMVTPEDIEHAAAREREHATPEWPEYAPDRSRATSSATDGPSSKSRYVVAGAGLAVGALVGGLSALTMTSDERRMRRRAEELRLRDRLDEAERRVRRAGNVQDYLKRMQMGERIDKVEDEVREVARRADRYARHNAR
ncbi:MAG TPA: YihY/virulence factor BrkB family protein [Tepidisphaeraceae bacterium]|nr:YihY/virulence factor BrkB family protein [Tepidisphaeraceae bacterium]